ncbi:MAG: hypothetical protein KGR26_06530, partial [Cyanobacteria bacterium REEB65]|nr:hypothetical protein [Cyanobacteria bacterium REEB65]
ADDLTGAGDAGLQFHNGGLRTWVGTALSAAPGPAAGKAQDIPDSVEAIALDAGTRHLAANLAADRVAEAAARLRRAECRQFYHKIDSTLRGNLGIETWRILHALELDMAIVAPAFPQTGRITVGGFQLVGGVPVALSDYGRDPLNPVTESHLPSLLESPFGKVEILDLRTVFGGWERIVGAVAEARARQSRAVVVDAAQPQDLQVLARAIDSLGQRVLPVGSGGLAQALGQQGRDRETLRALGAQTGGTTLFGRKEPVLVVSGSCNPTTLAQLAELDRGVRTLTVDVRRLLLVDATALPIELETIARQALQSLLAGRDVVLAAALSPADPDRDQALGHELGLSAWQVGEQIVQALGSLTRRLLEVATVSGLVVCGGQTAASVCQALGLHWLEIVEEVAPAVPLLRPIDRDLPLVTKSGGFGQPDTLRLIVDRLRARANVA